MAAGDKASLPVRHPKSSSWSDTLPPVRFCHFYFPNSTINRDQGLNHMRHFTYSDHSKNNLKSRSRDQEDMNGSELIAQLMEGVM